MIQLALILYIFYATSFKSRSEEILLNLRLKLSSNRQIESSEIAIVTIGPSDIDLLEPDKTILQPSLETMKRIIEATLKSKPRAVGVILPTHDFDYNSKKFENFANILEKNKNLFFGIFNHNFRGRNAIKPPNISRKFPGRIFGSDTLRSYKRQVIQRLPLFSFQEDQLVPHLIPYLSLKYSNEKNYRPLQTFYEHEISSYRNSLQTKEIPNSIINYFSPQEILSVKSSTLVKQSFDQSLSDRIVLIGYTAFRSKSIHHKEGTYVNTAWEGEQSPEVFGVPLVYVLGIQLHNLINNNWLKECSNTSVILQSVVVIIGAYLSWYFTPFLSAAFICFLFLGMIGLHSILFSIYSLYIPMADASLFLILSAIAGALHKTNLDQKQRELNQQNSHLQQSTIRLQNLFIDRFATETYEMTKNILNLLIKQKSKPTSDKKSNLAYEQTYNSAKELKDCLEGIMTYTKLIKGGFSSQTLSLVNVDLVVYKVVNQFNETIQQKSIKLRYCFESTLLYTDELLLENIAFNLISNAIKYSPKHSEVIISSTEKTKQYVLHVKDQGPGIKAELQKKIFQKFYRIKNDLHHTVSGNGLGLYLSHYFAAKINGKISVSSPPNKGSKFSLVITKLKKPMNLT